MVLPFTLETPLEERIAADPEWQAGVTWGEPRPGHMEGAVKYHIVDVLTNIDQKHLLTEEREKLRLIALIHDSFKYRVDDSRLSVGTNHHASIARRFAERYISDPALLDIIEAHDEVYHCWRLGHYKGRWQRAEEHIDQLMERLGDAFSLYVHFFFADSNTNSKNPEPMNWFRDFLQRKGYSMSQRSS
ncbi:hypothetical protein [Dictyobacter arantiisoli]|uniref:HD domain-containing protein n=1 Tax=Dictyobacter arantiisoli TaxID=2014874 RepID=A0A5A5T5Z1_9CHLR|nr:hypothetical protein [Dictyobacter arantiisoli]GCF06616.1 hypothetical protein KDI_01800 [Dictyobacter arantiisoli]